MRYDEYRIGVPSLVRYREVLNSDDVRYGGYGNVNEYIVEADNRSWNYMPYSITVTIPLSIIVLKPTQNESEKSKFKEEGV